MAYGKVIELFLANGTADSIVVAELSNWNGKAVKIPRIEVADCRRNDIQGPGVYFLFCREDDEKKDSVYIGESENLKERLLQHIRDYNDEKNKKEKYYWHTAIMFTGTRLNKALIRYLEDRLVRTAKESNRYNVLTKNTYENTIIKESERAAMEEFFDNIKILINALGYKVLESETTSADTKHGALKLKTGSACAEGLVTFEGFLLLKGAKINEKTSEVSLPPRAAENRKKMINSKLVENGVTTENIPFSSSSAAAVFVLGYSVSGPKLWKDDTGVSLRELELN